MRCRLRSSPALVARHGAGRSNTYDAALLDVAQDHLLWLLSELGLFSDGRLIFKGGTSLRKCRLGGLGRFSTDLDFAAPNDDTVLDVCAAIDDARVFGFHFTITPTRGDGRHWRLGVEHPNLADPTSRVSGVCKATGRLAAARLSPSSNSRCTRIRDRITKLPVIAAAEACAEKLARYRRVSFGRDVYDLAQMASRRIDEPVVRRLWVLKVWADVVDDGRGMRPLDPADVLTRRQEKDFAQDSIGKLTQPVDLAAWERKVRARFTFIADFDDSERQWALCDPRDRHTARRPWPSMGSLLHRTTACPGAAHRADAARAAAFVAGKRAGASGINRNGRQYYHCNHRLGRHRPLPWMPNGVQNRRLSGCGRLSQFKPSIPLRLPVLTHPKPFFAFGRIRQRNLGPDHNLESCIGRGVCQCIARQLVC